MTPSPAPGVSDQEISGSQCAHWHSGDSHGHCLVVSWQGHPACCLAQMLLGSVFLGFLVSVLRSWGTWFFVFCCLVYLFIYLFIGCCFLDKRRGKFHFPNTCSGGRNLDFKSLFRPQRG